uniref:Uncharacterized protein n=1 Tax=Ciona intestinalis TaxID=7719 RepID=H2Y3I3_CIOIN
MKISEKLDKQMQNTTRNLEKCIKHNFDRKNFAHLDSGASSVKYSRHVYDWPCGL